jgi:two-component system, OmpR family, sensor kinase
MRSLRARLLGGIVLFTIATGLIAGVWAFRWAFSEAIELQDAILLQIGGLAIKNRLQTELPPQGGVDAEAKVVIKEIWSTASGAENEIIVPKIPTGIADGLHTIAQSDGAWRVLVRTRPDGCRVAIAQPTSARNEIAWDSAVRAVLPLCALIPCLMLLTAIVIHYSFRPVMRLAKQLDAEQSDRLRHLEAEGIPKELQPFIDSINRLLARIAVVFDNQSRFIADAAHELRTPITALSIQAENLEHSKLSPGAQNRLIALKSGIRRTARLLEQLLALAKYDHGQTADVLAVRLDGVVKSVVGDCVESARRRSIDLGFGRLEAASVRADSTTLAVMIRNLVDNAIRYSPDGGRVDVSVFCCRHRVFLLVEDTGPGITDEALNNVFEPFNRGDRSEGDGTGLGLSIVRRIVENHQGTIRLENVASREGGAGLRATVILPAT